MSTYRSFKSIVRYVRNSSGNAGPIFAIGAIPLLLAAGGAIDIARWDSAKVEVKAALDAAVLAGTQEIATNGGDVAKAKAIAETYYNNVLQAKYDLESVSLAFTPNEDLTGLEGQVTAKLPTTVLQIGGFKSLEIEAISSSEVGYAAPSADLEVSVMLDVTGSMCDDGNGPCTSGTKISALKDAAKTLIDKVIWDDQSQFTSRVALVPFSTRVRVGPDGGGGNMMTKLTGLTPNWSGYYKMCTSGSSGSGSSENDNGWSCNAYSTNYYNNWKVMPCVTDRFYNSGWAFEMTDTDPKSGYFMNAHDGSRMTLGEDSSNVKATSALGKKKSDPSTFWNYDSSGTCYDVAQGNEVLPLTNDKSALKSRIDSLQAYGSTAGVLGTAFSWYMISPNWKNIWTGQSQPKNYSLLTQTNEQGKPKLRKVAVLMTDGVYNTYRGWKDQDKAVLSAAAKNMCMAMKAKGIEVFTVGFELDSLGAADKATATDVLKTCGTSVDHFYQSINAQQLADAFEDIGNKMGSTTIRLTK